MMKGEPLTSLVEVVLHLSATEARELYAELYRLSTDELGHPWQSDSQIAEVMRQLAKVGADT